MDLECKLEQEQSIAQKLQEELDTLKQLLLKGKEGGACTEGVGPGGRVACLGRGWWGWPALKGGGARREGGLLGGMVRVACTHVNS